MRHLAVTHLLIHQDVLADDRMRARTGRMRPFIHAAEERIVDDAQLDRLVDELKLHGQGHHGMHREVPMIVLLNRFRFDDEAAAAARRQNHPNLFRQPMHKLAGCGVSGRAGYEWRESGSPEHRRKTGSVCQPAWQIHTVVGCPFRCAYCSLGWVQNLMMNVEAFIERLDDYIGEPPPQSLYQHDNYTDIAEFEPEYGSSEALIRYFARKPGCFLELYVGKSANVDYLLNLDHRGKTTCCWSICMRTQAARIERQTAGLEARVRAARKCQQAGYPVRMRYSPIIPVRGWREELREMVEMTFALTRPEVITFETLRFVNFAAIEKTMDLDILDPEFIEVMRAAPVPAAGFGCEMPGDYRVKIYRALIAELERVSPGTPYALCRESRTTWDLLADDFARHGQQPDNYLCNCGPMSSPDHPLLRHLCRAPTFPGRSPP